MYPEIQMYTEMHLVYWSTLNLRNWHSLGGVYHISTN